MNVLSLFDGMSCGQIALNNLGFKIENYFASEIKKHAMQCTLDNFPDTKMIGDVTKVKVKTLCLSEVYSYICNYDNNLQSEFSEWEMLYWLDKKFTLSAKVGAQKPNEGQKVQQFATLQCVEEIRFSNNSLGSVIKSKNDRGSRKNGDADDFGKSFKLQRSSWRYDYEFYARNLQENIRESKRNTKDRYSKKENIRNAKEEVFKQEGEGFNFGKNQKGNVESRCEGKLLEGSRENKLQREVNEEEGNRRKKEVSSIEKVGRELQRWDEVNGIEKDYWYILRLHKEEQATVVEYERGFYIFKGRIDLCIGGSPCQDFSRANSVRDGLKGMKSMLFYEYIRLLEETKPTYYLLENVIMDDLGYNTITDLLGTEPVRLCGSRVSGALRDRLFWTNIGPEYRDLFGNRKCAIPQPKDQKIYLNDVLEFGYSDKKKHTCLNTSCGRDANQRYMLHRYATTGMTTIIYTDETMDETKGVRYCTQTELERLHNIPVGYTRNLNKAQAGNLIGDGWTVGIVEHIFSFLNGFEKTNVGGQKNNYGQTYTTLNRSTSPACC